MSDRKCPNCDHYKLKPKYDISVGGGFGDTHECQNCGYSE